MHTDGSCSYKLFHRLFALAVGIVCHSMFILAVGSMMLGIYNGLLTSFGRLSGTSALVANLVLVFQFPLLHSWLLTKRGRAFLVRLSPREIAADMTVTWFALFASLQILATFTLWSPTGILLFEWQGPWRVLSIGLYIVSSIFLLVTMFDADMSLQSGLKGWLAVFQNHRPDYRDFPQNRTFQICRQPIYLAFALILWTAPVWTADRLCFALIWGAYCLIGPRLKEARFMRFYGDRFRDYQRRVPYFLPRGNL